MISRKRLLSAPALSKCFCPVPFEEMYAFDAGAFACCAAWLPQKTGDFDRQRIAEIWNSPQYILIRQSILNGSFSFCNKQLCPRIKEGVLPKRDEVKSPRLRKIIEENKVVLDGGPESLNFVLDDSCNLSCPSCRNKKILRRFGPKAERWKALHENLLRDSIPGLRRMMMSGSGDPFASRIYREILTSLDGARYPKLRIRLLTNGQLLTPRMWQKMRKIHSNIDLIEISVDAATAETYLIVRRGGRLEPLLKNLKFLSDLKSTHKKLRLQLNFVVQRRNFHEMPDFVRLAKSYKIDRVLFQELFHWPDTFSVSEFRYHAIHFPEHPEHADFLEILKDPVLKDPIVRPRNLVTGILSKNKGL